MDKNNEEKISTNTKLAIHQAVPGYTARVKISDISSDKSKSSETKLSRVVHSIASESSHVCILTPVDTNVLRSPNSSYNMNNVLTYVIIPNHVGNNSESPKNVNESSESCYETNASPEVIALEDASPDVIALEDVSPNVIALEDDSPNVIALDDADSKSAAVQEHVFNVSQDSTFNFVAALLQDNISPFQSEDNEVWYNNMQQTITTISCVVEQIFSTSSEGILITLPCTPGFEKEKVGPADRATVKLGSTSFFGLSDGCVLEKKFNVIFHQLSMGFLSNSSKESDIKKFICDAMHVLMEVMPVEYAFTLICNCSLCWFLYMCAKVVYRDSPEESHKLNWSGSPISSYRCLAMRKIFITDLKSVADVSYDRSVNSSFSLQLRFTRSSQKRRLCKQSEHFKSAKRNSMGSDLNNVSKIAVRTGVNASASSSSFNNIRTGHLVKNTRFKFKAFPRFQNPEEDLYVFNPVRQFKGNTYTRRKNSVVR